MELHHKTLLEELRIDENGIFASGYYKKHFHWEALVGVIGYRKKKILGFYYCIGVAVQDENSKIFHFCPIATRDIWKYKYFGESTVRYLLDNHSAKGGNAWCARPLDKEGRLTEDNDLYQSYVLCSILADRVRAPWFDHTQDEEEAVALSYLSKRLIKDGTEYKQLSEAIDKTRFPIQEDGSINMFTPTGYRILSGARSIISSKKVHHGNPLDV